MKRDGFATNSCEKICSDCEDTDGTCTRVVQMPSRVLLRQHAGDLLEEAGALLVGSRDRRIRAEDRDHSVLFDEVYRVREAIERLDFPVFKHQIWDPAKLALIVRYQHHMIRESDRRDHEIIRPDWRSLRFELRANPAICLSCSIVKWKRNKGT